MKQRLHKNTTIAACCVVILSGCSPHSDSSSKSTTTVNNATSNAAPLPGATGIYSTQPGRKYPESIDLTGGETKQNVLHAFDVARTELQCPYTRVNTQETAAPLRTSGVSTQIECGNINDDVTIVARDNDSVDLRSVVLNQLTYHSDFVGGEPVWFGKDVALFPVGGGKVLTNDEISKIDAIPGLRKVSFETSMKQDG